MSSILDCAQFAHVIQDTEHLAGDVMFQATDDFPFGFALFHTALQVCPGPTVVPEPYDYYSMDCSIRLAVASAVKTVAVGFARRSGYRTHPTQSSKGGLGLEALGVTAGCDQKRSSRVRTNSHGLYQFRRKLCGDPSHFGVNGFDLLAKLCMTPGQRPQSISGRRFRCFKIPVIAPRTTGYKLRSIHMPKFGSKLNRSGNDHCLHLIDRLGASFHG
jgi:hypothetical protein